MTFDAGFLFLSGNIVSAYILAGVFHMSESRVTIYDIAKEAGVSIATVSRVLNDHPRVAPATRQRVLRVAQALNYRPHVSAQSLARRSSRSIAAVIPMMANYFYLEVLRGLSEALDETGFDLIVFSTPSPHQVREHIERALQRGRSAGLLLFSTALTQDIVERLRQAGQPVVLVDTFHESFDSISVDNRRGGYLATRHFVEQGYTRIGMIAAHPASLPAQGRYQGYRRALVEGGLDVDDRWVVWSQEERHHGYLEEEGYRAMRHLLERPERPQALFISSDIQALGALQALREERIRIPEEMAIIGFDDIKISRYVELSTMRQPMREMGKKAVEKLFHRIAFPKHPVTHTIYAPELVHRATCGVRCRRHRGARVSQEVI